MNYNEMKLQLVIPDEKKPQGTLVGIDGNVFSIISYISKQLYKKGLEDEALLFTKLIMKADTYDDVLAFAMSILKDEEDEDHDYDHDYDCDCVHGCKCL